MEWCCSDCKRPIESHTLREINSGRCEYQPPPPPPPKREYSPEANENTGEEFDLKLWKSHPLSSKLDKADAIEADNLRYLGWEPGEDDLEY